MTPTPHPAGGLTPGRRKAGLNPHTIPFARAARQYCDHMNAARWSGDNYVGPNAVAALETMLTARVAEARWENDNQ